MNFLDKLVIPLSPEHIVLLHYILMLIFFLFIPYVSIILGGTALSLYYRIKGKSESNGTYERFAEDVIETVTKCFTIPVSQQSITWARLLFCWPSGLYLFTRTAIL